MSHDMKKWYLECVSKIKVILVPDDVVISKKFKIFRLNENQRLKCFKSLVFGGTNG